MIPAKHLSSWLMIPATYFVMRKNGLCEWVHQRERKQPSERTLILAFEMKLPRSKDQECESAVHNRMLQ
jgi:hypothetical protein